MLQWELSTRTQGLLLVAMTTTVLQAITWPSLIVLHIHIKPPGINQERALTIKKRQNRFTRENMAMRSWSPSREWWFTFLASSVFRVGTWYVTEKASQRPIESKKDTSLVVPITRTFFPWKFLVTKYENLEMKNLQNKWKHKHRRCFDRQKPQLS